MSNVLDNYFGIHAKALQLWTQRSELLAANMANVDTPNYKAVDMDFQQVLQQAGERAENGPHDVHLIKTQQGHIGFGQDNVNTSTKYRVPLQPSLDGNTVDSHVEHGLFAENAIRHQISMHFLSSKITGLVRTLREE